MRSKCPYCGYEAECHTTVKGDNNPRPGDISFCIECGKASKFNQDLTKRKRIDIYNLNIEELRELGELRKAWREMKKNG